MPTHVLVKMKDEVNDQLIDVEPPNFQVEDRKTFKNLYGAEEEYGEHHVKEEYEGYPDLPSPRQIVRDISPKQCQQVVSPCAPITASAPTSVPTSESRARSPARQSDSDDIVAQLISENTRLNDEVQRLMVMVQAAQYQQPQAPQ